MIRGEIYLSQWETLSIVGNDSNLLIVFYVQIMPD
ncbi:pilus assembly protein, partial [Shigella sonnei]